MQQLARNLSDQRIIRVEQNKMMLVLDRDPRRFEALLAERGKTPLQRFVPAQRFERYVLIRHEGGETLPRPPLNAKLRKNVP